MVLREAGGSLPTGFSYIEPRAPSSGSVPHTGHELRYTRRLAGWGIPRGVQVYIPGVHRGYIGGYIG